MTSVEPQLLEGAFDTDFDLVQCWRFEELLRAGYDGDDAEEVASHTEIDLHFAINLVRGGCPSGTARRILL